MEEVNDRNIRKKNIIVFNAPESSSTLPQDIKAYETSLVASIVKSAAPGLDATKIRSFRLGQKSAGKTRPVKLIFVSEEVMAQVLSKFSIDSLASVEPNLKDIKLSRDRSPQELSTLKKLREDLDQRSEAGEHDLTIKYRNGVPKIVKKNTHQKN